MIRKSLLATMATRGVAGLGKVGQGKARRGAARQGLLTGATAA